MTRFQVPFAGLLVAALLSPVAASASAAPPAPWAGKLQPCRLADAAGAAYCGSYEVFENRDAHAGRKIALRIVVLPATAAQAAPDPVFVLSGGPGEGAASGAADMSRYPLRRQRDIVLVDVRGTGGSNGLGCAIWGDGTRLDHIFPLDAVRACRDRLAQRADLTRYTTAAAVDDLEDVRRYLGYGRIDLLGLSYGTLVAQVFVARHPASVRSVVLSGVAKAGDPSPLYHARNAQRAMELLARDCQRDAACHGAFPHFLDELTQVLGRLARQPERVRVAVDSAHPPVEVTLTRSAAAEAIRFALYSDEAGKLPLLVHQAAAGDDRGLAAAAVAVRQSLQQDLAVGDLFSVTCAEDLWRIDPGAIPTATAGTFYGDDRVREQLAVCALWPHAAPLPGSGALPPSPLPALLFSGERDPVTPPADAAAVAKGFAHGLWVQIPSGAHSSALPCEVRLIADFFQRGTVQGLDTSCVGHAVTPHFATH